jgi:hypothetical protein
MRGRYLPQLTVWHHVHPERLTRSYYRRWCFWHAVAKAVMRRDHPEPVASILGVPRYLYGRALRGALDWAALSIRARQSSHRFAAELATWDLLGFQYGRYVYRDVDPIARLAPSLTEHAGCSDLPAGCSDLPAAVGA